jgi:lipopolysaccharide/colanic/teichoic acid biosynthesis glycosyltransferase
MGRGAIVAPILGCLSWAVALVANDAFRTDLAMAGTEYYERAIRSGFVAGGFLAITGFIFDIRAVRPFILFGFPIGLVIHLGLRWLIRQNIRRLVSADNVVWKIVVVTGQEKEATLELWGASEFPRIEVVGLFQSPRLADVLDVVNEGNIAAVYASADSGLTADELRELGWAVERSGAAMWLEPATSLMTQGRISFVPFGLIDVMAVRTVHLTTFQSLLKRSFDLVAGLLLLVLLSPLFLFTAIVIALVDGFPILHSQPRVGRNGEIYRMYKFRTMVGEPSSDTMQLDEARRSMPGTKLDTGQSLTRTGKFLRRWSVDEIPQLVHVLTGKMSLVGPRPRLAHEMIDLPETGRRLRARPGLTGLWQVSGRADLSFAEADALDVAYVDRWSSVGDIAIVIKTIKAVLTRNGAK